MKGYGLTNRQLKKLKLFNRHLATLESTTDFLNYILNEHTSNYLNEGHVYFCYRIQTTDTESGYIWRVYQFNKSPWFDKVYNAKFEEVVFRNVHIYDNLVHGVDGIKNPKARPELASPDRKDFQYPYVILGKASQQITMFEGNFQVMSEEEIRILGRLAWRINICKRVGKF